MQGMMILKAIKLNELPSEDTVGGIFEGGSVNMKTLLDKQLGANEMKTAIVTFSPGARTKMHVHDHEQVLYILSGKGIVANEHEEFIAMPGMIFLIEAGEKHWHGATTESSFSHLFVYNSLTETTY
jgi:quercetin dioxygenase-like cupin family protein